MGRGVCKEIAMGNYEERKIEKAKTCYSCQHCLGIDADYEELYKCGYCMLDVPQEDIKHVKHIEREGYGWDERFCNIMGVNPEDLLMDSHRFNDPDDVCQFYEKRAVE